MARCNQPTDHEEGGRLGLPSGGCIVRLDANEDRVGQNHGPYEGGEKWGFNQGSQVGFQVEMRGFGLGLGSTMGLTSERIVWRCGSSWPPQGMVCWSAVRAPTAHAPAQRLCIVCKYVCARPYLIKIIPRSIHYMLSVSWNTIFTVRKICTYAAGYVFISCIKTIQLTKQNIATPSSGICGAGSKLLPKRFWRLGEFPCLLAARPRRKRLLGELLLLRGWIFRGCRCHSNNSSSCSVWPAPCDAWSPSETCRDQDLGNNGELKVLHLTRKTSKGKKWKELKKKHHLFKRKLTNATPKKQFTTSQAKLQNLQSLLPTWWVPGASARLAPYSPTAAVPAWAARSARSAGSPRCPVAAPGEAAAFPPSEAPGGAPGRTTPWRPLADFWGSSPKPTVTNTFTRVCRVSEFLGSKKGHQIARWNWGTGRNATNFGGLKTKKCQGKTCWRRNDSMTSCFVRADLSGPNQPKPARCIWNCRVRKLEMLNHFHVVSVFARNMTK